MNNKLVNRLKHLNYNHEEITFNDLRDQLFSNKTFQNKTCLKDAITYLGDHMNIKVIDIPDDLSVEVKPVTNKTKTKTKTKIKTKTKAKSDNEDILKSFTYDDDFSYKDNFDIYITDVKNLNHQLLTREEERALFDRIKQGDQDAKNELIEKNLKLVISIAKGFQNKGMEFDDLIQEGNIGLIKAMDKFDPNMNTKFSTYATYWIKQMILRALSDKTRLIRLPTHLVEQTIILIKVLNLLTVNEQEPSYQMIADYCNTHNLNRKDKNQITGERPDLTADDVKFCLDSYFNTIPLSIDVSISDDGEGEITFGECIPATKQSDPEFIIEKNALRDTLEKIIYELPDPRMIEIIKYRFGWDDDNPRTLRQTAALLGMSYERVRQLQNEAIQIMKNKYEKVLEGWEV